MKPDRLLRDYQDAAVSFLNRHIVNGFKDSAPTGAGKSLILQAFVERLPSTLFSHVLIAAPQVQIETGFLPQKGPLIIHFPPKDTGAISVQPPDCYQQSRGFLFSGGYRKDTE